MLTNWSQWLNCDCNSGPNGIQGIGTKLVLDSYDDVIIHSQSRPMSEKDGSDIDLLGPLNEEIFEPIKVRKRAILSRPGGDGRACPSLKSLEQKRDCSSRCQKPKLKFGSWSACKTGKSRYPSATCPGIQSRKIICSTSDETEFPIHKCLRRVSF